MREHLTELESSRLRRYLSNGRCLKGLKEIALWQEIGQSLARSTFSRLLTTDQPWRRCQAGPIVEATANAWKLDATRVWAAIFNPNDGQCDREFECVHGDFYELQTDDLLAAKPFIDQIGIVHSDGIPQTLTFDRSLPWHLLDEEVLHPVLNALTRRWCSDPEHTYTQLLTMTERQREVFMLSGESNPLRPPVVVVPISSLLDLLHLRPLSTF